MLRVQKFKHESAAFETVLRFVGKEFEALLLLTHVGKFDAISGYIFFQLNGGRENSAPSTSRGGICPLGGSLEKFQRAFLRYVKGS